MKKLVKMVFTYEDGTSDKIDNPRAAAMFQSRFNSSGIISGLEDFLVANDENVIEQKDNQ